MISFCGNTVLIIYTKGPPKKVLKACCKIIYGCDWKIWWIFKFYYNRHSAINPPSKSPPSLGTHSAHHAGHFLKQSWSPLSWVSSVVLFSCLNVLSWTFWVILTSGKTQKWQGSDAMNKEDKDTAFCFYESAFLLGSTRQQHNKKV